MNTRDAARRLRGGLLGMLLASTAVVAAARIAQPSVLAPKASSQTVQKVIFIDGQLPDLQQIADAAVEDAQVVVLKTGTDAIEQMASAVRDLHGLTSISIVSHGHSGALSVGGLSLHSGNVAHYQRALSQLGAALAPHGEIQLYGCEVGAGTIGRQYLTDLAKATGAVVAASSNLTGAKALGGDWTLEVSTAQRKAPPALDVDKLAGYRHSLPQPVYSSATGYISEQFFTINFSGALDAVHPPPLSAFAVQVNGTGVNVTGVTVNSGTNSVDITTDTFFLAGDIIDFVYTDPTAGNDINALQGTDGTDVASLSNSIIVAIGRPGPSAPATPSLSLASDTGMTGDGITSITTPTVTGTAAANSTVKLYDTNGTTLLGTTTADGSGNWSITTSSLSEGAHSLRVTQTNGSSQTSALSNGLAIVIDTTPPSPPGTPTLSAGSDSGTLGDGISNATTPTITGTGEANATVTLYDTDGTTLLGTSTVNGSGNWSITSSTLAYGAHTLRAKQRDAAGNLSLTSNPFSYTVDTIGPTSLALSTNTVFASNATNGAIIATLSSNDLTAVTYGFAVGNGVIDADNGKFSILGTSLKAAQSLTAGTYHIYLNATDAAGNASYNIFIITVSSNAVPVATNVSISGTAQVGQQLSGSYTYSDANLDLQGSTTFRWVRNNVNTGVLGGSTTGTASTYTLGNSDQGSYLYFCVTPVALTGASPGIEACTSATSAVVPAPVNGACGPAANTPASLLPSLNLCSPGNASAVTTGSNQYNWTCSGTNGGSTASCTANWAATLSGQAQGSLSAPASNVNNNWVLASASFSSPQVSPPVNTSFPFGLANFTLNSGNQGSSASVTINYTSPIPAGAVYMKYGKSPDGYNCTGAACTADHWYQLPSGQVAFSPDRKSITLTIADGGVGDNDLSQNSTIVDPGGPAVIAIDPAGIPTLSEWGVLILSSLMGISAFAGWSRRRTML